MGRKSIEDVMNEIEDFLNSCKTAALSSNKVVVPRDEFDELFGDLKVKIPAEIDRCKKIMRNKEAILMDARKTADGIIAQASEQANQMISETEIMAQANQRAYETVEMARVQANEMLAQAAAESNELRLGSMQYTSDIMMGIRNYVEATMEAERANYENLLQALHNDYMMANANLEEIQSQIVDFTGDPDSVVKAPQMKMAANGKTAVPEPKAKASVVQKVKQAVGVKEEKKEETKPPVNIPDFITNGDKVVPNETPLEANVSVKKSVQGTQSVAEASAARTSQRPPLNPVDRSGQAQGIQPAETTKAASAASISQTAASLAVETETGAGEGVPAGTGQTKKVKKKIVKKRNPVLHTPQTAQETVAKTLEAAAAAKVDKTVYKANGEQAREVPPVEGRITRGPRVGRGMVEGHTQADDGTDLSNADNVPAKSLGVVDDFSMEEKF